MTKILLSSNLEPFFDLEEYGNILYAGGSFSNNINFDCVQNVGGYNYQAGNGYWFGLGTGCDGVVYDLLQWNGNIYVAGQFDNCGGVPGTRGIAYWNPSPGSNQLQWNPLQTGFPGVTATGSIRPFAMESFGGSLYVGGNFGTSNAPASLRVGAASGLFRWDGTYWYNVYARCEYGCDVTEFEAPFQPTTAQKPDPTIRGAGSVTSLRNFQGRLYVLAPNQGGASTNLLAYDGSTFRQYGSVTGASCVKQGCLSRNNSVLMVVGNEAANFNPNIQAFSQSGNNFINVQYGGFDAAPTYYAAGSTVVASLILGVILALFALAF